MELEFALQQQKDDRDEHFVRNCLQSVHGAVTINGEADSFVSDNNAFSSSEQSANQIDIIEQDVEQDGQLQTLNPDTPNNIVKSSVIRAEFVLPPMEFEIKAGFISKADGFR